MSFELNDQYTVDTEELRATARLSYDNLFQRFHSFSLQYTTAPENIDDTEVWAATYLWRFEESPAVLAFYAVDTASDVSTVGDINVIGSGRIYGVRYVRPLSSDSAFFHSVTLGYDYKDFDESIGESLQTPISYSQGTASYAFGWNTEAYRSSYNLGFNVGLRALGNGAIEFADKRFRADPNYAYLTASTEHLIRGWGGIGLYGRLVGQYASRPLIANEQFSAGGINTVRGYLEAEQLGDFGVAGQFELRSPDFGRRFSPAINQLYLLAFYDAATFGIHDELPGQDPGNELFSTGLGFRLNTEFGLRIALDWARAQRASTNVREDEDRFHFIVNWGF